MSDGEKKLTKDELLERLTIPWLSENVCVPQGLYENQDAHEYADKLLLEYIGDEDIRAAFQALPKWYA